MRILDYETAHFRCPSPECNPKIHIYLKQEAKSAPRFCGRAGWSGHSSFCRGTHPFYAHQPLLICKQYCVSIRSIFINIKTIFVCKLARGSVIKPRGFSSCICVSSLFIKMNICVVFYSSTRLQYEKMDFMPCANAQIIYSPTQSDQDIRYPSLYSTVLINYNCAASREKVPSNALKMHIIRSSCACAKYHSAFSPHTSCCIQWFC